MTDSTHRYTLRTRPIVVNGEQAREIMDEIRRPPTQEEIDRLRQILSNRVPRIDKHIVDGGDAE